MQDDAFVENFSVTRTKAPHDSLTGRGQNAANSFNDSGTERTGDAKDADATPSGRGGDSGDGIGHD